MSVPRVLVVDNVDSFTFMLVDYLATLGADVAVKRNDALDIDEAIGSGASGILISPGPGKPEDAGISVALAAACIERKFPLLGVCLGHQAIAIACGSRVERTPPVHGKVAELRHDGSGLFRGIPSPFAATRYHSLAVQDPRPPLVANAWSNDGTVMAMRHIAAPVHGIQFHPESIASEQGEALLAAFIHSCRVAA
ncbi:aminodeoxychorismate/anthranilate synthase component II [Sphingomonas sp. G124]|uniref:Aminodeoxychorismate/anthranilate synthase component II n=1 Tax=Sphingomonas cremea TaxID=2904799 RepID=A0A9X1QL72_9SPHN|nr:aminodeoxychorismate/anthranilate synthase component II [Sphingomonas cremea]MCF2513963.1 aminodeoxychorismate/anthranilate synthase component II [Sphingomonas cremea]